MIDQFLVSPDDNEIESTKQQVMDLTHHMIQRFKDLIKQERHGDALAIADEYFEWLDPDQMDDEQIVYVNYDEIRVVYQQACDE